MSKEDTKNEIWSIGNEEYALYTEDDKLAKEISQWNKCHIAATYSRVATKRQTKSSQFAYHVHFPRSLYNRVAERAGLPQRKYLDGEDEN